MSTTDRLSLAWMILAVAFDLVMLVRAWASWQRRLRIPEIRALDLRRPRVTFVKHHNCRCTLVNARAARDRQRRP